MKPLAGASQSRKLVRNLQRPNFTKIQSTCPPTLYGWATYVRRVIPIIYSIHTALFSLMLLTPIRLLTIISLTLGTPIVPLPLPLAIRPPYHHPNTSHHQRPPYTNLTTPPPWSCYPPYSGSTPPSLSHCTRVIRGIQGLSLPRRPLLFSRAETADFVLPVKFVYQTCRVVIDVGLDEEAEDRMTRRSLISQIGKLEDACVVQAPFLGGEGPLGRRGVLKMRLMGMVELPASLS